ncbi:MAG TPA: GH1 family beta-glucosidase [Kiritimatiellia bacterium]|nr:GH1 family beta-glucosidase [Kiritimatiellia bacterium]
MKTGFPKNFAWGAATAAYQIEGAAREDGRGPSVWDMFCRKPGATWYGHSGDVACDHYHRWKEDIGLMKAIGLKAYRMSVSWPRVLPQGVGRVNAKGLGFYDKLVDGLLAAGITPYITLFHWDFPYELYCRGGWLNRDSADWFADYTQVVVDKLGDRVKHWITLNEPQCFIGIGHYSGIHAPGDKLSWGEVLRAGHHAMLAHGRSVQVLRAKGGKAFTIGYAPVGWSKYPASERAADQRAARKAMFSVKADDYWNNTWWMDPILKGAYPEDGMKVYEKHLNFIQPGDLKIMRTPIDFLGLNIYAGEKIRANREGLPEVVQQPVGQGLTAFYWFVTPDALGWTVKEFHARYGKPIIITENGMANCDWVALDGRVHDPQRIDFTMRYLRALRGAIAAGADVRGYFHWSLMDNFEWGEGYKQRFGLIHVDYPTGKRTPKDSAAWYGDVIRSNGATLG